MAGLVPAIPLFAPHRSTRRGSVDALSTSGHDEATGVPDRIPVESRHSPDRNDSRRRSVYWMAYWLAQNAQL